jgi:hypothetical protein
VSRFDLHFLLRVERWQMRGHAGGRSIAPAGAGVGSRMIRWLTPTG